MTTGLRIVLFGLFCLAPLAAGFRILREFVAFTFGSVHGSHIILMPLVSAALVYRDRKAVFSKVESAFLPGAGLAGASLIFLVFAGFAEARLSQNDYLALIASSVVLLWFAGFLLFFGSASFRAALFPLLLLGFVIPIPTPVLDCLIRFLQAGSTEAVNVLFRLCGTPVYREGYQFALPGISIEVARECGGIRSSIALLITSLLAGHLFLDTGWKRLVLMLAVFPVTMFKNGVRIVTLSLMAVHVDSRFLAGHLHREGGIPFFLLALALLTPVLALLRKSEKSKALLIEPSRADSEFSESQGPPLAARQP